MNRAPVETTAKQSGPRKRSGPFTAAVFLYCLFHCADLSAFANTDPYSLGMGNSRIFYGGGSGAASGNPAILGARFEPWGGAQLLPLCSSVSAGYWSDKLALTPYREFLHFREEGQLQRLAAQLINESFRVSGKSAAETSERISGAVRSGISIFGGSSVALFNLTLDRMAVDVRTFADVEVSLPGAPFLILFSGNDGLIRGGNLPLSVMGAQARIYTDISVAYGLPVDWSEIAEKVNWFTKGIIDLRFASCGFGLTVTLGNGYLDLKTVDGGVHWNSSGSELRIDADMRLKTSGSGLRKDWTFGSPFAAEGLLPAGAGAGINAGVFMYGEHASIGVTLRRLGPMVWRGIQEADLLVRTRDLSIASLLEKDFDLFDSEKGGNFPDPEQDGRLHDGPKKFGWLPTRLNTGIGYRFNFRNNEKKAVHALSEYVNTSLEYEQSLAPWPGRSFVPRIAVGAENAFLWGFVPVRLGFSFGGAEKVASSAGFAIGVRTFCFQAAYQAIGTPYWFPKRGFELSAGFNTEWRRHRDPDGDGISDRTDRCPFLPEDADGFEDADGCPDTDNDGDGMADTVDGCRDVAEDRDGYEDADGCPDPDNDRDSIADAADRCPLLAEDSDGFEDADGCPDPDNDGDGIADTIDKCINTAEDRDGVADEDGCPDDDADGDGIADSLDRCPSSAEIMNHVRDDDGCPDSAASFSSVQKSVVNSLVKRIGFTFSGNLKKSSAPALDSLAVLLGQFPERHYLMAWCDSSLADSVTLLRSGIIADAVAERGFSRSRLELPVAGSQPCGGAAGLYLDVLVSIQRREVLPDDRTAPEKPETVKNAPPVPKPEESGGQAGGGVPGR